MLTFTKFYMHTGVVSNSRRFLFGEGQKKNNVPNLRIKISFTERLIHKEFIALCSSFSIVQNRLSWCGEWFQFYLDHGCPRLQLVPLVESATS